jgi:hypothetical protein
MNIFVAEVVGVAASKSCVLVRSMTQESVIETTPTLLYLF